MIKLFAILLALCLLPAAAVSETRDAAAIVRAMTPEEKITQLLMPSLRRWKTPPAKKALSDLVDQGEPFTVMNDAAAALLTKYKFGAVILFAENLSDTAEAAALTAAIRDATTADGGLPPLIAVDQEGGSVARLDQGTRMPGSMAIAATGDPENAYRSGAISASEIAAVGIDMNMSPDADVSDNPNNPVINLRSFGSDPATVATYALRMMHGIRDAGVIPVCKHFPGHGNTDTDSHTGLPRVNKDIEALKQTEFAPFQALIDAGIPAVMSAHIQFPALDDTTVSSKKDGEPILLPATLSPKILTGLLRETMGFDGVIITDSMQMDAIAAHFSSSEATIMAIRAGADLICMPVALTEAGDAAAVDALIGAIKQAVDDGTLTQARIDEAAERVVSLKLAYGVLDEHSAQPSAAEAREIVGSPAHRLVEREIAEAAITCYRNDLDSLPFTLKAGERALFVTPFANEEPSICFAANRLKAEGALANDAVIDTYVYKGETEISDTLRKKLRRADYVIVCTEMAGADSLAADDWHTALPRAVWDDVKTHKRENAFAVVSIGSPYDAVNYADVPALVFAYGSTGMSAEDAQSGVITSRYGANIPAAVGGVLGTFPMRGTLPVVLPL